MKGIRIQGLKTQVVFYMTWLHGVVGVDPACFCPPNLEIIGGWSRAILEFGFPS